MQKSREKQAANRRRSKVVRGLPKLSLAVDSVNAPALKLYYRHGMRQMTRKLALMRDLSI